MLDALVTVLPEIEALGAPLIALTPDTGPAPHDAKTNHGATFDMLSDVDCGAVFAPGGVFRVSPLYKTLLITVGLDMPRRHGNEAWFLLIPAVSIGRDQGRWVEMGLEGQVDEQRLDGFRIVADRVTPCGGRDGPVPAGSGSTYPPAAHARIP